MVLPATTSTDYLRQNRVLEHPESVGVSSDRSLSRPTHLHEPAIGPIGGWGDP